MERRRTPVFLLLSGLVVAGCLGAADPEEARRIDAVLGIEPGMIVADVGAGDGDWAIELSDAVGPEGTVFATEVEDDLVERLGELGLDNFRSNIVAVQGDELSTGLDDGCCDAILLRMVYHHFTDPAPMRASLRAALRPGGRLAVIDIVPQRNWGDLSGVPDRGGHGIPMQMLIAEMVGDGFEVVSSHPDWRVGDEDRYCVVFRAGPGG